jgi:hypothetical protein
LEQVIEYMAYLYIISYISMWNVEWKVIHLALVAYDLSYVYISRRISDDCDNKHD